MGTHNPFDWSAHLLRAFYGSGVQKIVLSPGSRSTPLALAAKAHPGFDVTVVIDERSAAYVALGMAKSNGIPALLICTSGTALANYAPAAWESRMAGVPMVILSADRPPNQRATGSSQTIDHLGALGAAPVFFHECGEPHHNPADLRRLGFAAYQAVETSIRTGGTSHLNLPFRKPFEPTTEEFKQQVVLNEAQMREAGAEKAPFSAPGQHFKAAGALPANLGVKKWIRESRRPLLVMGAMNPFDQLTGLPELLIEYGITMPVIGEPGGQPKAADWISSEYAGTFVSQSPKSYTPDLLIRIGKSPTSSSALKVLEQWMDIPLIHFTTQDVWEDPFGTKSTRCIVGSAEEAAGWFDEAGKPEEEWLIRWKKAGRVVRQVLENEFGDKFGDGSGVSDPP